MAAARRPQLIPPPGCMRSRDTCDVMCSKKAESIESEAEANEEETRTWNEMQTLASAHIVSDALEFMSGSRIRVAQLQITLYTRMFSMYPEAAVLHVRGRQTPAEEGKYRNLHDKRIKHQIFAQNTTAAASVLGKYLLALCCHFIFRLPKLYVRFSGLQKPDRLQVPARSTVET